MSNAGSSGMQACRCAIASITRKQLVGLTGLGLSLFVLIHMAGNMLIFVSPRAYNEYGHAITANPFLYVAELGLIAFFLGHAFHASYLTWRNYRARPEKYAVRSSGAKRTPWIHRTLFAQGLLLLVFVILHLITFKYGPHYEVDYGHGPIRDLFKLMLEVFTEPGYVIWYVIALLVLCMHLSHGFASTFQTLGVHHVRYQCGIQWLGRIYALVVGFGFISQPIYIFLFYKG
jgi:succinate dehydrogenase / fumarate reductase cytochrome b subunit